MDIEDINENIKEWEDNNPIAASELRKLCISYKHYVQEIEELIEEESEK